jgi:hypothetical protein
MPTVEYGEREIDFKMGAWHEPGKARLGAASLGFGYGVTQRWFTEIYRKYEHTHDEGTTFDAWEWENKFQLTETGQYPVDVGFIVELERAQDRTEGYETRFGPLFQTEFGKVQLNTNFILEHHYRAEQAQRTEFGYQWQAKYRWRPELEWGFQGFGETGKWDHWDALDQQSHRLGPAVFGRLRLGDHQAIRYNAAWLVAASENAPRNNFRMQVEYEF